MSQRRNSEPAEQIYTPRPSWAPAVFAFAAAVTVCGIFAEGLLVRGWIYSVIGAVVLLAAFRSLVRGAIRDYRALPARQRARAAVLPVEPIKFPPA